MSINNDENVNVVFAHEIIATEAAKSFHKMVNGVPQSIPYEAFLEIVDVVYALHEESNETDLLYPSFPSVLMEKLRQLGHEVLDE